MKKSEIVLIKTPFLTEVVFHGQDAEQEPKKGISRRLELLDQEDVSEPPYEVALFLRPN